MKNRVKSLKMMAAACLLLSISCVSAQAQSASQIVGMDTLLNQEMDLSQLPELRNWTTFLQSSYDRTGGNSDYANYLSVNGETATLADMDGPGAIVRIWSANPSGQIKIYIDNSPTPVIDTPFAKLFDGSSALFPAPLAQISSGGNYAYLPIPYSKHCLVTVDNPGRLYYHVNYVTFVPGTNVRSFSLPLEMDDKKALDTTVAAWKASKTPGTPISLHTVTIAAGKTKKFAKMNGPALISQMQFSVPNASDLDLRQLVLRGYFDGHTTPDIEAPLADFFGNGYGRKPFESLLISQSPYGTMTSRFPMPFGKSARFTLENGTRKPMQVGWGAVVTPKEFNPNEEGYFRAQWFQEATKRNVPHVWTHISDERGKFVGIVQTIAGSPSLDFIEGDEQIRVDNQQWGASQVAGTVVGPWNGTGTEDCFNSGWAFADGPIALPSHGALVKDSSGGTESIDAYRWFFNDAPIFQDSLDAQIEHGGGNNAPDAYYSSVAYWYATGQKQEWAAMPAASSIRLPVWPNLFVLDRAIEGESLVASAKATGGGIEAQDMAPFDGKWSRGAQLLWRGSTGDTLALALTYPPGTYNLTGYFTKAADYGQASFTLNGRPVGSVFDGYNNGVIPSGPVSLGRVTLDTGSNLFTVTMTGKNAASTNTLFGLDALVLVPAGE